MKQKLLIGFTVVALGMANLSHANFILNSSDNSCANVPGKWAGSGKAHHWMIGECVYNGVGIVSPLDSAGRFVIDIMAEKYSGSFVCPSTANTKLSGVCVNGTVTFNTEYGNLNGVFSSNSGTASGKLTVSPGIDVDLSVRFNRS